MSRSNLTRWIETADARTYQVAQLDRGPGIGESHYQHLGEATVKTPSWPRHRIKRDSLAAIGGHALAFITRPRSRPTH